MFQSDLFELNIQSAFYIAVPTTEHNWPIKNEVIPESGYYLVSCVACAIICICLQQTAFVSA